MDPVIVSVLAFVSVAGVIGVIAYYFRDRTLTRASERLDVLV